MIKRYDLNGDFFISPSEESKAISDWLAGKISDSEVLVIIKFSRLECRIPRPTPVPSTITVISPNGGETWEIGKTYEIKWRAENVNYVGIELIVGEREAGWLIGRMVPASQGTYTWTVPSFIPPGNNYRIKISNAEALFPSDVSDNYFSIVKPVICTHQAPRVNIFPLSQTGFPGQLLIYRVYLSNLDSKECDPVRFQLKAECPENWRCEISPELISVPPAERGLATLRVGSLSNTPAGVYSISVTATHGADPSLFSKATATYVVSQKEDPISGTLSVDKTFAKVGEEITLTITAKDLNGVDRVMAYYQGKWNSQSCDGATECTKTFTFSESVPGVYFYYGYVYGRKTDGSLEGKYTSPSFVKVVILSPTPTPTPTPYPIPSPTPTPSLLPDLIVQDIYYDEPYIRVRYCNIGSGTSTSDFLIKLKNNKTGQEYGGNPYYRFKVPQPGKCEVTGGYTPSLIGLSYGQFALVTAIIDWENRVVEANENNNLLTKTIGSLSLKDMSEQLASLEAVIKQLKEDLQELLGR